MFLLGTGTSVQILFFFSFNINKKHVIDNPNGLSERDLDASKYLTLAKTPKVGSVVVLPCLRYLLLPDIPPNT